MEELTDREREWCRLVVQGVSQADAYRKAFNRSDMSAQASSKAAYRLSKKEVVRGYMDSLRTQADVSAVLGREERMLMLSRMAVGRERANDVNGAVSCIRELNKMDGAYEQPDGVQVQVNQGMSVEQVLSTLMEK